MENVVLCNAGSKTIVSGKKAVPAIYGSNAKMSVKTSRIAGYGTSVNADAATVNTFKSNAQTGVQADK